MISRLAEVRAVTRAHIGRTNINLESEMNDEQKKDFEVKAKDLMDWLCANGHPHMTIVITPTSAELLEGCIGIQTNEFVRD